MKSPKEKFVDKTYKLTRGAAPLSYMLPTRNSRRFPILWFDEEKGENRALRYSRNQNSPFEDEQDGNIVVEPIIFEDGFLTVGRTNQVLQKFLHYHPLNGKQFVEVNKEKDAADEIKHLNVEVDALIKAKELSIDHLEVVCRVAFGKNVSKMTTAEMKRDVLVYARSYPADFLDILNDPELQYTGHVQKFFDEGLLATRRSGGEVWFTTPTNKKKMLNVPFGQEPTQAAASFLKSDDGIEALKMLESLIEV